MQIAMLLGMLIATAAAQRVLVVNTPDGTLQGTQRFDDVSRRGDGACMASLSPSVCV
jgi:hypothetical protein